jgi:hypothetical protein
MRKMIIEGIARAFFVMAYASASDEGILPEDAPRAGAGDDWVEVAPESSTEAKTEAEEYGSHLEKLNAALLENLFSIACNMDEIEESYSLAWEFGWYLGMQALGSGVSWFDDHEKFPIIIPHYEYYEDFI